MPWIEVGSTLDTARKERDCLNAYMFWTDTDCYSMTPQEARKTFDRSKWWTCHKLWIQYMILTQDKIGLQAMREEYTKITGNDWKTANLSDVFEKLGYCNDLWEKGLVCRNGLANINAMLKIGVVTEQQVKQAIKDVDAEGDRHEITKRLLFESSSSP